MNIARLQDIYNNIDIADRGDMDNIRQLTQDYPFYWMPYVILAKYYYQTGHYKFEDTLRQAAMRVHDRRSLYDYIHGRKQHSEVGMREVPAEVRQAEVVMPVGSNESGIGEIANMQEAVLHEEPVVEQESVLVAEEQEEYRRPNITDFLDSFVTEQEKPTEFVFGGKHEPIELDSIELDQDIIGEEIETEFSFSKSYAPEAKDMEDKVEEAPVQEFRIHENAVSAENAEEREGQDNMDFFSWLDHPTAPETQGESESENEGESENEYRGEERIVVREESKEGENNDSEADKEELTEDESHEIRGVDLIERFIASNPQISRPKKEFYNPENMAKRSEVIDLEYVTETLANLYYEQGNVDLAIKAYEKLSLQNPLKEPYFASLIEKIKKEKK